MNWKGIKDQLTSWQCDFNHSQLIYSYDIEISVRLNQCGLMILHRARGEEGSKPKALTCLLEMLQINTLWPQRQIETTWALAQSQPKQKNRVKTKSNRVSGMVGHKIGAKRAITVGVNTPNLQSPLLWNRLPVPLHGHSGFKHNIKILNWFFKKEKMLVSCLTE